MALNATLLNLDYTAVPIDPEKKYIAQFKRLTSPQTKVPPLFHASRSRNDKSIRALQQQAQERLKYLDRISNHQQQPVIRKQNHDLCGQLPVPGKLQRKMKTLQQGERQKEECLLQNKKRKCGGLKDRKKGHQKNDPIVKPSITFGTVEVREYARCLGDHPEASPDGPSLSLDWAYETCNKLPLDRYEVLRKREKKLCGERGEQCNCNEIQPLDGVERGDLIRRHVYCTGEEIKNNIRDNARTRRQREQSRRMNAEEAWSMLRENCSRVSQQVQYGALCHVKDHHSVRALRAIANRKQLCYKSV